MTYVLDATINTHKKNTHTGTHTASVVREGLSPTAVREGVGVRGRQEVARGTADRRAAGRPRGAVPDVPRGREGRPAANFCGKRR